MQLPLSSPLHTYTLVTFKTETTGSGSSWKGRDSLSPEWVEYAVRQIQFMVGRNS